MMEYLSLILSFILGGGLSTIFTVKYVRRAGKIDFADKAITFMEKQNNSLMKRVFDLESDVKALKTLKCERIECQTRL